MINPDLVIPERFVRVPGEPARHRGPTRSINARLVADAPKPCVLISKIAAAERAALDAEMVKATDLAEHGRPAK